MKPILILALFATSMATSAVAQDFGNPDGKKFSVDLGLGVSATPTYPGSDEIEAGPWLIWRNAGFDSSDTGDGQGFSVSPSFNLIGPREAGDDAALTGLQDIDRAYELGGKISYGAGAMTTYGALRKGFGGHEGLAGEIGANFRTDLNDRVTLWSGLEFGLGDSEFNKTYFGVTPAESAASGYSSYAFGSGINSAAIKFSARYAISDSTALLGEVEYGKLVGDVADSPIVQDEYQPALRIGIVRKLSFGF